MRKATEYVAFGETPMVDAATRTIKPRSQSFPQREITLEDLERELVRQ